MKQIILAVAILVTHMAAKAGNTDELLRLINEAAGLNAGISKFGYKAWYTDDGKCMIRIAEMIEVFGTKDTDPALYDIDLSNAVLGETVKILPGKNGKFILQFDKRICKKNNRRNVTLEVIFFLGGKSREAEYREMALVVQDAIKASAAVCKGA